MEVEWIVAQNAYVLMHTCKQPISHALKNTKMMMLTGTVHLNAEQTETLQGCTSAHLKKRLRVFFPFWGSFVCFFSHFIPTSVSLQGKKKEKGVRGSTVECISPHTPLSIFPYLFFFG